MFYLGIIKIITLSLAYSQKDKILMTTNLFQITDFVSF